MAKSALPIIAVAGAAAFLMMPKKKPSAKKSKKGNGNGDAADPLTVDSGMIEGWGWRVRQAPPTAPGFGEAGGIQIFYGQVHEPNDEGNWKAVHQDGVPEPKMAKNLALEFIAGHLEG